ncbi:MAG: YlxR family protein [Firmicutes bacterium]|nr:YlxR family protein [Bacillota bacterium]MBQ3199022.1 YlxR family protein [Bacillota bacterium]
MAEKAKPQRTCIACRQMQDKQQLNRVVRTPEGEILLDDTGRRNGRGAYLCKNPECLKKAFKSRALERALKQPLSEEIKNELLQKYAE